MRADWDYYSLAQSRETAVPPDVVRTIRQIGTRAHGEITVRGVAYRIYHVGSLAEDVRASPSGADPSLRDFLRARAPGSPDDLIVVGEREG